MLVAKPSAFLVAALLALAGCEARLAAGDAGAVDAALDAASFEDAAPCSDTERWQAYDIFGPACLAVEPSSVRSATGCELVIEHVGRGLATGEDGAFQFYKVYVTVNPPRDAEIVEAGLLVRYTEGGEAPARELWSIGAPLTSSYYRLGVTHTTSAATGAASFARTVLSLAVFADLREAGGEVVRVWAAPGVGGFSPSEVFVSPLNHIETDFGWMDYAIESTAPIFAVARSCAP